MDLAVFILKLSSILFFIPATLYGLFHRFFLKGNYIFAVSMGLSPAVVSWLYALLLRIFPGQSSTFYVLLTTLPFLIILLKWPILVKFFKEFDLFRDILKEKFSFFVIFFLLSTIIFCYGTHPIDGNDPLGYFYISYLIDLKKNVGFYPSTTGLELRGAIFPFTHPIGYPSLLAWGRLGLAEDMGVFTGKILSFMSTFLIIFILCIIQVQEKIKPLFFPSLVFLTTPFLYSLAIDAHIDSIRMLFFLMSFLTLYDHFKSNSNLLFVGICCGFSWFFHSSGILTLLMVLITYGCFSLLRDRNLTRIEIKSIFLGSILIIFSNLLLVITDIMIVYSIHGRIIGDRENIAIINFLSAEHNNYLALSRDINSLSEKFLKFVNQLFFSEHLFGVSYWIALGGLIINAKITIKNLRNNQWNYVDFSATIVMLFYSIAILVTLLGVNTFVMNPRYLLQVHPFVVFLGIPILNRSYFSQNLKKKIVFIFIVLLPLTPLRKQMTYAVKKQNSLLTGWNINKKIDEPYIEFLNKLNGLTLVIRQGELLNYTNLNLLHVYDKYFFDNFFLKNSLLGIKYIVIYNDAHPVMETPLLKNVLYNFENSSLIFDHGCWKIFQVPSLGASSKIVTTYFKLKLISPEKSKKTSPSLSHKYDYSSLMPTIEVRDFPQLEPGLYDVLCAMEIEVDHKTKIDVTIKDSSLKGMRRTTFYLKEGRTHQSMRFLQHHLPFRLELVSENKNINFHHVKISFKLYKKLISPDNVLYNQSLQPVVLDQEGKSHVKVKGEKIFFFENPFLKEEFLNFKISGYGEMYVYVLPSSVKRYLDRMPLYFKSKIIKAFSRHCYKYVLDYKVQNIYIPFDSEQHVYIVFKKAPFKEESDFILSPIAIKKGV